MNILLIAGHGAGDPGATSTTNGKLHKEAEETRRVVAALQPILQKYCKVSVYPTSRNAFEDHKSGTLRSTAKFENYNYVLEIHFNAFQNGPLDGKTKGVECYVTSRESGTTVEQAICKNIAAVGLTNRGVKRYNWSVINSAKNAGVSSALLEVCFIDDPDDMKVYTAKFNQIVEGIAKAIVDEFGLGDFKMESQEAPKEEEEEEMVIYKTLKDIPKDYKPTIEKLIAKGAIEGTSDTELNLEENMVRGLVINDRMGLYDK